MRQLSQREFMLLGLLALGGVILFYFSPKSGIGSSEHGSFGDVAKLGEAPVVNVDRLAGRTDGYDPQGRNLFQFYTPPPPVVAPPPPPPPTPRPEATPAPVIINRDPSAAAQAYRPQPPAITLTYLGFLGPKENRIAVFEDGGDMLLAKKGDVVKQQFRVVDFGYEAVVMGYVDERFRGETQELPQQAGAAGGGGRSRGRR